MPGYAFFNAFSDFAVASPCKIEPIKKLSKLIIIHRPEFMFVRPDIQENKFGPGVMEWWRNGVLGKYKL
jgi:hypothetical protein